jgi:phosphoglycolate phosphatase
VTADPSFKFQYALFDFDGTLADSTSVSIEVFNELASENGFQKITDANYNHLRTLSIREMIRELKVPVFRLPALLVKGRKRVFQRIDRVQPFREVFNTVTQLKNLGMPLGIFSTNSQEMIRSFLDMHDFTDLFDPVVAGGGFLGKRRKLLKFLRNTGIKPEKVVYFGDEVRDIEATQSVGMKMAAVTWGVNDLSSLQKLQPDFLIDRPEQILQVVRL